MQITDEMVGLAAQSDAKFDGHDDFAALSRTQRERYIARSRAALEAVLGAICGDAGKFVKELKDSAYWQSNEDYAKAAACIEDLAGALRPLGVFGDDEQGWRAATLAGRERARATLERWGLK